jgi:hypothetical protein
MSGIDPISFKKNPMLVLPETGWAIVKHVPKFATQKAGQPSSYLFFSSSFHSRVHKHADDNSLILFDQGREILIDSGKFGYGENLSPTHPLRKKGFYYEDQERIYVESTMAHNTVQRNDEDHNRRRTPYGSGLKECQFEKGIYIINAEVQHDNWEHTRKVYYKPSRWLVLHDLISSSTQDENEWTVWFNFPLDLEPKWGIRQGGAFFAKSNFLTASISLRELNGSQPVLPVSGQKQPLRGWRSTKPRMLTPSWSCGFRSRGVNASFLTVLSLSHGRPSRSELARLVHNSNGE